MKEGAPEGLQFSAAVLALLTTGFKSISLLLPREHRLAGKASGSVLDERRPEAAWLKMVVAHVPQVWESGRLEKVPLHHGQRGSSNRARITRQLSKYLGGLEMWLSWWSACPRRQEFLGSTSPTLWQTAWWCSPRR